LAIIWTLIAIVDLWNNSVNADSVREGAKYLIYFTHWGVILVSML
jgi:hypothetical protein